MFFTRLGTIAAWLALIAAVIRIALATYVLFGISSAEQAEAWTARYLGKPPGQALDHALVVLACAIVLGILTEISRAVQRRDRG